MRKWILLLSCLIPLSSMALIVYKSVDSQGNVSFSMTPSPHATAIHIQPVQTIASLPTANTSKINEQGLQPSNNGLVKAPNNSSTLAATTRNIQPLMQNSNLGTTHNTLASNNNSAATTTLIKTSVNQKLQQLEQLQIQLNLAASDFERAREAYASALVNYLTAKHALEAASVPSQNFLNSQQLTANFSVLKQNFQIAESTRDQAHLQLQQARENFQIAMNKLTQFLQANKNFLKRD